MNLKLKNSRLLVEIILLLSGLFFVSGSTPYLLAATINVSSTVDENDGSCSDGDCSLRDAIFTAFPGDTISIPSGTYVLTLGELVISKNLTLIGAGPAPRLDGNAASRVLRATNNVALTLNNLIVTNGQGVDGGGIATFGSTLNLVNSQITGNSASNNGGGIYLGSSSTIVLDGGTVDQNTAVGGGGGIYNIEGTLIQTGGVIKDNFAGAGGGVYVNLPAASFILNGGLVQQNSSTALEFGGGGVYVAQGTVTINGGQILNNDGVRGGGIQSANGKIFLNGGLISQNQAQFGGGVYLTFPGALLTQSGGEISQNSSVSSDFGGGGVYGFQGNMMLTGGLIRQNTAVFDGGGINIRFGNLTVTGGSIVNNQAGNQGGGIYADQSMLSIGNLQLGENLALTGGGLYLRSSATLTMTQTAVYSNTATLNGGGLVLNGNAQLTNATISSNQAQNNGGGIWSTAGNATLENITLSQNSAVNGGGLFKNGESPMSLHNSLLAGNVASTGPNCSGSFTSNGYNLIQNGASCTLSGTLTGNILGQNPLLEPLSLNYGTTFIYPLNVASPAIDTGDPLDCPATDQHGQTRPLDGKLDGTIICDIGAFEYGIPLHIGDVSVMEGNSGSTLANFPVTLEFAVPVTVTVAYASSNQSAFAGLDYTAVSGTLTFSPGEVNKTIAVPVLGDLLDEENETYLVILSNSTFATVTDGQGTGTIIDNDPAPSLSLDDVEVIEGDSGSNLASFTVTLAAPSGRIVQVNYATDDGNAKVGIDYTAVSGTLIFTPGQTSKTILVPVLGDLLVEGDETFMVNLSNLVNVTAGKIEGTGTILDDDRYQMYLPVVLKP